MHNPMKGEDELLSLYLQPRHWSPREGYATGDVLLRLLGEGWRIAASQPAPGQRRAPLFILSLEREGRC